MKLHILMRRAYGDFDIPYDTPTFASYNKEVLTQKCVELNGSRTEKELSTDVEFFVDADTVKVI